MSYRSPFILMRKRRFSPLFWTQFLGAFNDNLFKNALIILIAFSSISNSFNSDTLINASAALFIIPYFIFSAMAGQLADKYEKARLIRYIKFAEICLVMLATLGFYLDNLWVLLISLFLLGVQATFFGPIKYSILPQHLQDSELIAGNGLIEMGTFVAILLGTIAGGFLVAIPNKGLIWVSIAMFMAALFGFVVSLFIPSAKAYVPNLQLNWNPWRQTLDILKIAFQNKEVFHSIIGISWFWMYGSLFLVQMANYTKLILGGDEHVATLFLTIFSVGIGMGSILCNRLSHQKIEPGLVLFGATGLSIFALDFSFAYGPLPPSPQGALQFLNDAHHWRILADALLMGTFGGFYVVPLYALVQNRSRPEECSRIIAANNVLNAILMTISAIFAIVFLSSGFNIPQLFRVTALLNAIVALYLCQLMPEFYHRFLDWIKKWMVKP